MTPNSQFYIYSASAGSGKTFTLTKEYLKLCLNTSDSFKFREILAITFTNKASAEMKNRILQTLKNIANKEHNDTSLQISNLLIEEIGIEEEELQKRTKRVLQNILHNYADFSIGTIDHFTHKLIRTFATDLKLNPSFDIELDQNRLLKEATDRLINQAGENADLTKVLGQFVDERLEDERSWNIENAILEVAQHINKEKSRKFINGLNELSLQDFLEIKKTIDTRFSSLKGQFTSQGEDALALLKTGGIEASDLAGGATRSIFNYFKKVASWNVSALRPSTTIQNNVSQDKWLSASGKKAGLDSAILSISGELSGIFYQIQELLQVNENFLVLGQQIKKEFHALAVLEQVNEALESIKEEENIIPISEFNHLISKEIQAQPIPYIYERMGEKYKSFFIDEFQDTSVMQWQNLLPLINNAMSQGGYCLLVGDAKQSIYRWRGGDAEQFIGLYEDKDPSNRIWVGDSSEPLYSRTVLNLENNWRSRKEIVQFNNELFQNYSSQLSNEAYKEVYGQSSQVPKGKDGGYVQLEIVEEKEELVRNEIFINKTIEEIDKALQSGFMFKDICVLVKKNSYASDLLQSLTHHQIPAYAAGALAIKESREVQWVISVLRWMISPEKDEYRLEMLKQILANEIIDIKPSAYHDFLIKGLSFPSDKFPVFLKEVLPELVTITQSSFFLYDICERLLIECNVWNGENALISSFLNEVHNFSVKKEAIVPGFLIWWDDVSDNITIDPPEDLNQVAVMTVHKSKGLEFPVVILPFADWSLGKSSLDKDWISLPEDIELPSSIMGFNKNTAEILGGEYALKYNEMNSQAQFDNLNVLYVASTRARDVLVILSRERRGDSVSDVFKGFLDQRELPFKTNFKYSWGDYPIGNNKESQNPKLRNRPEFSLWNDKIRISSTSPIGWPFEKEDPTSWGKKVHHVMSLIQHEHEVDDLLNRAINRGDIDESDLETIRTLVESIVYHDELKQYFSKTAEVFNERNILIPSAGVKRPDRLVRSDKGWVVIDYKTGEPHESHIKQVDEYASFLSNSFDVDEKILIYINDGITIDRWS